MRRGGVTALFFLVLSVLGCQTHRQKAEIDLQKKLIHFSSLESRLEKTCLVRTTLSSPTQAKYQQSYTKETSFFESKDFVWDLSPRGCNLVSVKKELSEWEENHLKILKGSFCTLLMGFQIQSPLAGVDWINKDHELSGQTWSWKNPSEGLRRLSMTLKPSVIRVESAQGAVFIGEYTEEGPFPKLTSVKRESSSSGLRLDGIQFQDFTRERVSSIFPREINSLNIHILDESSKEFQFYGKAEIIRCE